MDLRSETTGEFDFPGEGRSSAVNDRLIDALADRMAFRLKDNSSEPEVKKFLGLDRGSWTKFILGSIVAAVVWVFTWHNTVNAKIGDRPTAAEVQKKILQISVELKKDIDSRMSTHATYPHPVTAGKIEAIAEKQAAIEKSQIRQEGTDKTQTEILKNIKEDMRYLKRRAR